VRLLRRSLGDPLLQVHADFADKYAAHVLEKAKAAGATAEAIQAKMDEVKNLKRILDNPFLNAAATFIEPFPVGLIITLISALILRKRKSHHQARVR
jgi:Na+/glutamate symporter